MFLKNLFKAAMIFTVFFAVMVAFAEEPKIKIMQVGPDSLNTWVWLEGKSLILMQAKVMPNGDTIAHYGHYKISSKVTKTQNFRLGDFIIKNK
jgi:hypothetical protein